jgi:hypothetical protein
MNNLHMVRPRRSALAVALALGLGMTGAVYAQATTGSIFGAAPVASGETVLISGSTGVSREVAVDANTGRFSVSGLPVGTYSVTLRKDGQTVATHDRITVSAGAGAEVPFTGPSATEAQNLGAVSVVASALPAIDVTSVNSSTVITSADLKRLPVVRNAESIALLAPGTVQGSGYFGNAISFGGAGVTENAYYVNGYNTTEPYRNTGGFQLPYGAIDQQQTFTGGYSAQYGRSDGGVLNQIGKRGTNEWHFGASVSWAPSSMEAAPVNVYYPTFGNLPAGYSLVDPTLQGELYHYRKKNKSWQTYYSAYVGGPLIKDKLYFFLAADTTKDKGRNVQSIDSQKDIYYTDKKQNVYTKLDWNINDNNILELTSLYNKSNGDTVDGQGSTYGFDYDTLQATGTPVQNNVQKDSANIIIGKYTSYITDDLTFSATFGKGTFRNPVVYANNSPLPHISGASSQNPAYGSGIVNGNNTFYAFSPDAQNKTRGLRADLTYQLGSHQLGAGIDNMNYEAHKQGQGMSGPGYGWIYGKTAAGADINSNLGVGPGDANGYYVRRYIYSVTTSMSLKQKAWYLQDVWNVTDKVQLNIGLRNDRFTNYNDLGIAFVDEKNQWEPRLGASWDVFGDSTFKVYGNAGRYYLALPDNVAERAANRSTFTSEYFTYTGIDANGIPTGLTPVNGTNGAPPPGPVSSNNELGQPKDARQVTAKDLKAQYQDEYILGFDKTLGPNWVYGAKLTFRQLKTAIDDECDPGRIADKMTSMGLDPADYSDALGNPYCRLINPGQTNTLEIAKNGGAGYTDVQMSQQDWGFLQGAKRKYEALDLYLEHPFDGKWQARVDYTYARNKGNTEGQVRSDFGQADVSKTEDWDSWQLMDHAYGDLLNSRKHSLRFRGAYQMTPEWMFSGTLLVQSGTPATCLGAYGPNPLDSNTNDPIGYGVGNYHWCFGRPANPGTTGFTPWTKKLNLGVTYSPEFADHKLAFQLQVFNALNEQKAVQIDPTAEVDTGTVSNTYGQPLFLESPRYVRFTVSYDY